MDNFIDSDGYTISFSYEDIDSIKSFFDEYGFVIVNNILSDNEIDNTINDIYNQIEVYSSNIRNREIELWSYWKKILNYIWTQEPSVKRNQPSTFDNYWPCSHHGIFTDIAYGKQIFENRQSLKIYQIFKSIIGIDDLLVSLDRFGYIRSSQDYNNWLHWDINPWFITGIHKPFYNTNNIEQRTSILMERWERHNSAKNILLTENNNTTTLSPHPVQGLISLSSNKQNEGGFCCIPSFHKKIKEWAQNTEKYTDFTYVKVPKDDIEFENDKICKIAMRKGSLLIWSATLPHCNYSGEKDRICQYIKMFPKTIYTDSKIHKIRNNFINNKLPNDFKISNLGKKLFGYN